MAVKHLTSQRGFWRAEGSPPKSPQLSTIIEGAIPEVGEKADGSLLLSIRS